MVIRRYGFILVFVVIFVLWLFVYYLSFRLIFYRLKECKNLMGCCGSKSYIEVFLI